MKNIIVCVKVVPKSDNIIFDPVNKRLDRTKAENQINAADKSAIETALRIRERVGGKITLLSMGPPFFEPFLKLGIAMGVDEAILLSDRNFGGADTFPTALVLATAIKKIGNVDLVLTGEESSDAGLGQVPSQIAEFLDFPQVLFASTTDISGGKLIARRSIKGGYEILESDLPAVVSVVLGAYQPRFPDFKKKKWADNNYKVKVWNGEDLQLSESVTGIKGSFTTVKRLVEIPQSSRKKIIIDGTPEEKSSKLVEILRKAK